jgi:hypothetical protein
MVEIYLGKIESVIFGNGGYDNGQMGVSFTLAFEGRGVQSFICGAWDPATMPRSDYAQWTEADRDAGLASMCRRISQIMADAKVGDLALLKGKPVEVSIENNSLKSWRILKEVL